MKTWLGNTLKSAGTLAIMLLAFYAFRGWYMTPSVADGEAAKDFSATLADGTEFELSSLRGQYVLLHFWGSWCGPCRRQNPELVKLVRRLNGKLVPVSIAIERNEKSWQAAIKRDGLYWPHHILDRTSNLKFLNGPISDLYGVNQVPTDFLLDPTGKVVAVNPGFGEIINVLADAR